MGSRVVRRRLLPTYPILTYPHFDTIFHIHSDEPRPIVPDELILLASPWYCAVRVRLFCKHSLLQLLSTPACWGSSAYSQAKWQRLYKRAPQHPLTRGEARALGPWLGNKYRGNHVAPVYKLIPSPATYLDTDERCSREPGARYV